VVRAGAFGECSQGAGVKRVGIKGPDFIPTRFMWANTLRNIYYNADAVPVLQKHAIPRATMVNTAQALLPGVNFSDNLARLSQAMALLASFPLPPAVPHGNGE